MVRAYLKSRAPMMATVFTPYTDVLVVLAGLLMGSAAIVALVPDIRASAVSSVPVAVAVLLSVLALPVLWRGAAGLDAARAGLKEADPAARHNKCFLDKGFGWQLGFVAWIQGRIGPGESFAVHSRTVDRACFQLSMLPRRLVRPNDRPDWTVWIGEFTPELRARIRKEAGLPPEQRSVQVFDESFALIRERR